MDGYDPAWTADCVPDLLALTQAGEIDRCEAEYRRQREAMDKLRPRTIKSCVRCNTVVAGDRCLCGGVRFNYSEMNISELLKLIEGEDSDESKLARFDRLYEEEEKAIAASMNKEKKPDAPLRRDDPFPAPVLTGIKR